MKVRPAGELENTLLLDARRIIVVFHPSLFGTIKKSEAKCIGIAHIGHRQADSRIVAYSPRLVDRAQCQSLSIVHLKLYGARVLEQLYLQVLSLEGISIADVVNYLPGDITP